MNDSPGLRWGLEPMKYTAKCVRSGDWWAITVPEIKGVFSQARRLDQVEAMTREAIALMLDVDPHSFDIDVQPEPAAGGAQLTQGA
ncbi:Uncharacterised protein family (UPF0150) [Micromonospora mirobrigensis]|uniref:Uncharacterized protein family (UPF0150) n=2 Tax=Micromonospora mirobrigensis TaxID=262898 RepID=A0A1C4V7V5_9ACTN|nr:Uncharacterised protein family (UPF0150) [Micromonospora mirobrigensis]